MMAASANRYEALGLDSGDNEKVSDASSESETDRVTPARVGKKKRRNGKKQAEPSRVPKIDMPSPANIHEKNLRARPVITTERSSKKAHVANSDNVAKSPTGMDRLKENSKVSSNRGRSSSSSSKPKSKQSHTKEMDIDEILAQIELEDTNKKQRARNRKRSVFHASTNVKNSPNDTTSTVLSPFEVKFKTSASVMLRTSYTKGLAFYKEKLEIEVDKQGEDDPSILRMQGIMADLLVQQHYLDEALDLLINTILKKEVHTHGRHHKHTIRTLSYVGSIFSRQDKWDKVLPIFREVSEKMKLSCGVDDPEAIDAQHCFAIALHKEDDSPQETIPIYKEIYEKAKRIWGGHHEKTLQIAFNYGCALEADGNLKEAYDMFHTILEKREKILGPKHFLTITCQTRLAHILEYKGKSKKSIDLFQSIVQNCCKTFGEYHGITNAMERNLAHALIHGGRAAEGFMLASCLSDSECDCDSDSADSDCDCGSHHDKGVQYALEKNSRKAHEVEVFKSFGGKVLEF